MPSFRSRTRGFFANARITPGAMWLLFLEVGFSLVALFVDDAGKAWLASWVLATDETVWGDFKLYTVATTMFLEPRFIGLLFHGLMLWMFVPALEKWWGTKRFLMFAVGTSAAAAAAGTLVGSFLPGLDGMAGLDAMLFACIVAYGVIFARSQVYFFAVLPMTGKQLAFGMSAFVLLMVLVGRDWANGAGWAAGMLLALVLTSDTFNPRSAWLRWRHRRIRRHLKLVDDKPAKRWIN
jgi:membrane associated rhomboid family serine protease